VSGGVLVVDKPQGMTSHAVVAGARKRLGTRAVGHAGTLDPMATGVLLLLVGEATKLSAYLTLESKAYVAEVRFGRSTDSLDADGETVEEQPVPPGALAPDAVAAALAAELERTEQVPPAVSAIQVDGERSHRLARRGTPPVLPPRAVRVRALCLSSLSEDRLTLEVAVSKGYYVRSLARDLGERLGLPAHLSALRRTQSGDFSLDEAHPWPLPPGDLTLLGVADAARRCLPIAELTAAGVARARLGQTLGDEHFVEPPAGDAPVAWLEIPNTLVAIGSRRAEGHRVLRGFHGSG
jgi:tRNA pseudouridine55 synthase